MSVETKESAAAVGKPRAERPTRGAVARRDWAILAAILLVGLLLRVSYLREVTARPIFSAPIADAAFHDYWARAMVSGDWTPPQGEPDPRIREVPFLRPPGYPYFLSLEYALTGLSLTGARIIQMLLGLANVFLLFLLGRAVFNRAIGVLLAAFAATYWALIYYEAELHSVVLSVTLGLGLLLALQRWSRQPGWPRALLAGGLLGLSALVRPEVMLFIPVAAAWLWWFGHRRLPPRRLGIQAGALIAGALLVISPATIRNAVVSREFVPISANGAINFYVGNNETADGITTRIPILPELGGSSGWSCFSYDQIVSAISQQEGSPLTYADASAYFSRLARTYIRAHPGGFLRLCLRRAALFWDPAEVANNQADDMEKRNSPTLRFLPGFPYAFSLSLLGLGLLLHDRRGLSPARRKAARGRAEIGSGDGPMLVLIGLFILTSFAATLPFIAAGRLRAPVVPILFVFGAYGLHRLWFMLRGGIWKSLVAALVVWIALFGLSRVSWAGYHTDPAWWHTDRALALYRQGQNQKALAEFQAALEANPGFVDAHVNLARVLTEMGRADEAIAHYQIVVANRTQRVDVRYQLGAALLGRGRTKEAVRELREVVRQNPRMAEGYFDLGRALLEMKDYPGSLEAFDQCLRLTPDEPGAFVNRGIALTKMGRPLEGIAALERAIQLKPDLETAYTWLGTAQMAAGELDKAESGFQEAIRKEPGSAEPLINMGYLAARRERPDEAVAWYQRALKIDPNSIVAHYNLARIFADQGRIADAEAQLREVLRVDPGNELARDRLNQLLSGKAGGGRRPR